MFIGLAILMILALHSAVAEKLPLNIHTCCLRNEPASSLLPFTSHLSQVLRQKQVDDPEIKQVSVRRFSTFGLFTRRQAPGDTSGDQWVEYSSVHVAEGSCLLR